MCEACSVVLALAAVSASVALGWIIRGDQYSAGYTEGYKAGLRAHTLDKVEPSDNNKG